MALSDEHLVELSRRAVAGDDGALEDLLTRLYVPVSRFLRRRLGDDPHAEGCIDDLTQEVLVRIMRFLGDCSAASNAQLMAWVLAIARRQMIEWIRFRCREKETMRVLAGVDTLRGGAPESEICHCTEQEGLPENHSLLRVLMDLHDRLPATTQQLLWLRVIEAASWVEIAIEMQTTASAAKRRFQRVQQKLRGQILHHIGELPEGDRQQAISSLRRLAVNL